MTTREVVIDTETTGLNYKEGDRIIEIACIELIEHIPTGKNIQFYFNPETKKVNEEATKIHGISNDFLKDKPFFKERAEQIINFIQNDPLVIHNASFDMGFINNELNICNIPNIDNKVIDTIYLAKKKLGAAQVSLDALCKRYNIDLKKRKNHGALLDANLLADVYLELLGGRQAKLNFYSQERHNINNPVKKYNKSSKTLPLLKTTELDLKLHKNFIKGIKNSIWQNNSFQFPKN